MRALLYLLLISINIVLPSVCFGQLVTTSNSIKEIIIDDYHPKSGGAYFYNNSVNNWPACSAPSDLNFQLDGKGNLTLSWDGDEKQNQNYQYEIKFPEGAIKTGKNIITVSSNKYNLRGTEIGARSDFSVSVRKKCLINKDVFYSNWVTQEIILVEPANNNNATCPQLADLVYYVPNVLPEIKGNDTLKLHNSTYDTLWVKFNGVYWGPGLKSSDPKVLVKFSEVKKIPYGQIGVLSVAKYHRVEASFLKALYIGNALELNCPPVIFVKPKECITNAFVGYTKTTGSYINHIQVKLYGGASNVSGFISSNQETVQFVNGQAAISSCSEINIQLFAQNLVGGVLITESCDPIVIDNHCSCLQGFGITIRSLEVEQPTCSKSTGTIRLTVPGYLSSIGGEFADLNVYSNLQPGLFYITLKDVETNCLTTPYLVIINEQPPIPEPPTCMVIQQSGCNGQKGIIEVTNPTLNFNYSLGTNFGTSTVFTNLNAGYYQVSAKNPQGCISVSDTLWVVQGNTPTTPQVTLTQPSCSPVVSTGTITVTSPTGSDYTYAVNSGVFQTSSVFSGLLQGTYSVTVKSNVTGCTSVLSNIGINGVPNLPIPNVIITTQPSCTVSTGTIWVSAPIGPQYVSFSIGGAFQSSRGFSNLQPGTYNVVVKTNTGCISSPRIIIINPNVPAASVTSQPTCTSILGAIGFTAPAGADFNYSINNGTSWQSGSTFSNLSPGTYLCKYKNTSTNCISQALTLVVNPPPTFAAPEVSLTQATCTDLFGSIQISSPLGSEYSYSINTVEPNFQSSPLFSNRQPGTYNVIVRNNNTQCYSQVTSVEIYPLPDIPDSPTFTLEQPNCFDLTGVINIDSPLGWEYEYSIDQQNFEAGLVFNNLLPGTYSVVAKHVNSNCLSSLQNAVINSVPEQIQDTPSINISQLDCLNTTGSISVANPLGNDYLYRINGGQYQSSPVFNNLEAGSHEINYKMISSQCYSNDASALINNFNAGTNIGLSINSYDQSECNPNNSSINIISPLGSQYQYRLNEGEFQNQPIFSHLMPGDYKVEYRNSETGCIHPQNKIENIKGFPCEPEPEFICDIINSFKCVVQSQNSFLLIAPENLLSILNNNNTSPEGINHQFSFIKNITLELNYYESNLEVRKNFQIYNSNNISDISEFDVTSWSALIENATTNNLSGQYSLTIILKNGLSYNCDPVTLSLENESVTDPENHNSFEELPVLDCNSDLPIPDISSNQAMAAINVGDIIFIQAFPILITFIENGSTPANFSGKGILPIPFGSKNVLVEFNNLFVNENSAIKSGEVSVVSEGIPENIQNPDPLIIGGDICIPPPPPINTSGPDGVDAFGFNPTTGLHTNETFWDDNGFDKDGNYKGTDPPSKYNENGCNREGWSNASPPQKCDPTLPPNPPIAEVSKFITENGTQIDNDVVRLLNQIKLDYVEKLSILGCNVLKTDVQTLNDLLQYNKEFTIGNHNEYIDIPELVGNFQSQPKKSEVEVEGKNANTILLENKHVDLYECAVKSKRFQLIVDKITEILNNPEKLSKIKLDIKKEIEKWNSEDAARYIGTENQASFDTWIQEKLKIIISDIVGQTDLFSYKKKSNLLILPVKHEYDYIDYYGSIASIDKTFTNLTHDERSELEFYLKQDFQTIKGIDRAFYLESMARQINLGDVGNGVYTLPITIEKQVGSLILTLILDKIRFNQNGGIIDAYIVIEDPESQRKIVFKGLNIGFNTNGPTGNNKMFLGNDVEIRINNAAKLVLKGNPDTYIKFDCDGFDGMGIDAEIEFCRNFIVPLNATLNTISDTSRYRLSLKTTMTKWLDFSFTINASPFALAKYEDIKFKLTNMVIDMSSTYSPPLTAPEGYQNSSFGSPMWRGFYIESLKVVFPNEFSSDTEPIEATINNLIIDGTGVSGQASIKQTILSLEDGNIGGWAFSIEELSLKVLHNNFSKFGLKGELETPLFEESFSYEATVNANKNYKFTVFPRTDLTCNLLLAEADLKSGSGVTIEHDIQGFHVKATLNGSMRIKGLPNVNISVPEINFNGLEIGNRVPYFKSGNWELPLSAGASYKGFELSIEKPEMYKPIANDSTSAGLMLNVKLTFDTSMSIALSGSLSIDGKLQITNNKQKWINEKVRVHNFCLTGNFPGVKSITGCINFFDETNAPPEFGKGFKGGIKVEFESFLKEVTAIAQFGKVNNKSYFFVDASASLQTGIPLGPISLNGFSGGVSYHMSYTFNPADLNFEDDAPLPTALGKGLSGMTYVPDFSIGLGLSAGAMFSIAKAEEVFNGSFLIKAQWYETGGLDKMSLTGIGKFISPIDLNLPITHPAENNTSKPESVNSVISGYVHLEWVPGTFTGRIEAFLQAAGGIEGAGTGGKLVDATLLFTSGEWYIYYGIPVEGKKCGIKFGSFGSVQSYFCMGTKLPDFPELPANVRQLAPLVKSNSGLRGGGNGMLFGMSFDVSASLDVIGIIKGSASAGGGFDVMLRKYNNIVCAGGDNTPIGWNGWYASGQAWAYIKGELAICGYNVIKAGIAAVLQARLPNPTWVQGTLGIKVESFLGDFDYDMKVEFGETCDFVSIDPNNQLGLEVIASTDPIDQAISIPVDAAPKVYFNLPIDKEVTIRPLSGAPKTYKTKIKKITLKYGDFSIALKEEWAASKNEVTLRPYYFLPPNTNHTLNIEVDIYEGNVNQGYNVIATEEKIINFKTSGELESISEDNITASYPINGMKNFYKEEEKDEYIILNQGLYDLLLNQNFNVALKLNGTIDIPVIISNDARRIDFDLSPFLNNETEYELSLVRFPKVPTAVVESAGSNPSQIKTLYTIKFRTSKYNTFAIKMAAINIGNSQCIGSDCKRRKRYVDEPFDVLETYGNYKYLPLVQGGAIPGNEVLSKSSDLIQAFPFYDELTDTYCNRSIQNPFKMNVIFGSSVLLCPFDNPSHIVLQAQEAFSPTFEKAREMCESCLNSIVTQSDYDMENLPDNSFYRSVIGLSKLAFIHEIEYKIGYTIPSGFKKGTTVSIQKINE